MSDSPRAVKKAFKQLKKRMYCCVYAVEKGHEMVRKAGSDVFD